MPMKLLKCIRRFLISLRKQKKKLDGKFSVRLNSQHILVIRKPHLSYKAYTKPNTKYYFKDNVTHNLTLPSINQRQYH